LKSDIFAVFTGLHTLVHIVTISLWASFQVTRPVVPVTANVVFRCRIPGGAQSGNDCTGTGTNTTTTATRPWDIQGALALLWVETSFVGTRANTARGPRRNTVTIEGMFIPGTRCGDYVFSILGSRRLGRGLDTTRRADSTSLYRLLSTLVTRTLSSTHTVRCNICTITTPIFAVIFLRAMLGHHGEGNLLGVLWSPAILTLERVPLPTDTFGLTTVARETNASVIVVAVLPWVALADSITVA
jgi:hypothetical protein